MKAHLTLFACVFCWLAMPAGAHRLDEYLQATTIAVARDHLVLQLRLTPGVAVAGQVLASLDGNGDGTISDAEQRTYTERVRHDLSLTFDDGPLPIRLVAASFPGAEEMTSGSGDILLTFQADLPTGGATTRRLTFENHHQSASAGYLVNCLLPRDPGIHVVAQVRSHDQARYQLDFTLEGASVLPPAANASANALPRPPPANDPPMFEIFSRQGVRHLFTGYDHWLFVGVLVLGAATLWELIKVVHGAPGKSQRRSAAKGFPACSEVTIHLPK